jgi:hypothetical protein
LSGETQALKHPTAEKELNANGRDDNAPDGRLNAGGMVGSKENKSSIQDLS